MWNVAFLGNAAGFAGGAMHLSNTLHLDPGRPYFNITIVGNTAGAFAAGTNVFGGEAEKDEGCRRTPLSSAQLRLSRAS